MSAEGRRRELGDAAVLSESDAAALLPFRRADAVRWLRAQDLVRDVPALGRLVIWGDVLERLREATSGASRPARSALPPPSTGRLPRSGLAPRPPKR